MKIVVIRCPETNAAAGVAAQPEAPSPEGQEQLSRIAEVCRSIDVQVVIHSTRRRAAIAAETLASTLGVPFMLRKGLEERDFGDWNNWDWSQISAELGKLTTDERYTFLPPGGESWQQLEERLHKVLDDIASLGYGSVAVLTHWSPIRAILQILRGEPREAALKYDVANGQCYIEEYQV